MTVAYDFQTGGFDLHFTIPTLAVGQYVQVNCDSAFVLADAERTDRRGKVRLTRTAYGYTVGLYDSDTRLIEQFPADCQSGTARVRVTVHNTSVSVVVGDLWLGTMWLDYVNHAETPAIWLAGSTGVTVTDICLVELADCREQVPIDIDTSSANAIAGVIGNRPVKSWARYDGAMCFAYSVPRQAHSVYHCKRIERSRGASQSASSDALVFHQNMAVVVDLDTLEQQGFVTRSLRFPDLEHGAITAAIRLQEQGRQERETYEITRSVMPALEPYDVLDVQAVVSGGHHFIDAAVIVTALKFSVADGAAEFRLSGRVEA